MTRLFAFGDSFSLYHWPMWPNIIGQNFDITYNYGNAGSGNFFIFYRAVQCLLTHSVNSTDTVIVQWSVPTRFDHVDISSGQWNNNGDTSADLLRSPELEKYNSDYLCILKQLTYMNALAKLLDQTGCNWYFIFLNKFSMVHLESHEQEFNLNWSRKLVTEEHQRLVDNINQYQHRFVKENFYDYLDRHFYQGWKYTCSYVNEENKFIEFLDTHPSPMQNMAWINDNVLGVIPGLDADKMNRYAKFSQDYLDNLCPDGKYQPKTLHNNFLDFEEKHNFKKITRNYHV